MSCYVNQAAIEKRPPSVTIIEESFPRITKTAFTRPISSASSIARTNEGSTLTLLFSKLTKVIDPVNGPDRKIDLANEYDERLADRQKPRDRRILADVAKVTPIEPLLRIPEAEQNEYENAADNYSRIRAFEQFAFRLPVEISDYLPRQSRPKFHQ